MPNLHLAMQRALDLLQSHGIQEPPVDVRLIAEKEGVKVIFENLEDEISGVLVVNRNGDTSIGVNKLHHPNRQRFTLAHELAHWKLHPNEPTVHVDESMLYFRGEGMYPPSQPGEVEANYFAANLLMPETFLRRDLSKVRLSALDDAQMRTLAQRYGVSAQALTIRLMDLRLLGGLSQT
jgi:Zn-dependent peptidase ImmA (M78 family)